MNKSFKFLLPLVVLAGCNTLQFWKSDEEKVSGSRHAPALNNAGMDSQSMATPPSSGASMAMSSSPSGMSAPSMPMPPETPEPPALSGDDFMSNPAIAQSAPAAPANSASTERRAPEFNRQLLGQNGTQNAPSGDLVAASPTPGVSQTSMPQGDLQLPPPPPVSSAKADNAYPRLADVPPSPPVPTAAKEDARVAQMKQDLADMQQQQANFQSSGNSMSIKGGAGSSPVVQTQTPRSAGNQTKQPTLIAQSPADPYLAKAQTQSPPASYNMSAGSSIVPPPPPMMQQAQAAPAPQPINQASIAPQGPTVVVHSKNPNARPYNPQMAMAAPPLQSYTPVPPPQNFASNSVMPPEAPQSVSSQGGFRRVPSMGKPAGSLGSAQRSSSTSLSQLRPIAVEPTQTFASSNDSPSNGYSEPSGLQPIPTNNIHILPASRYSTMRSDARDGSGY